MEFVKSILKGIVIGIANIVPGVSGGTMMVSMGIYDKLIHCITHFFKDFKENIKFLLPIGIGVLVGFVGLALLIKPAFAQCPLETNCCFVGLILGGLPAIFGKVKGNKFKWTYSLPCIAFFVLVVGLALIGEREGVDADLSFNFVNIIKLFGVGILASGTMMIPGVSGSMIMLLFGYYKPVVSLVSRFLKAIIPIDFSKITGDFNFSEIFVGFDFAEIISCCGVFIPLGLGIVVGVILVAKLLEIIFEKCPMYAYWAIIGLIAASPFAILYVADLGVISVFHILASIVTFAAGFFIAMKLGD